MKKQILFSIVCISMAILVYTTSCNKAANPTTFGFKVNGVEVNVDSSHAILHTYTGSVTRRELNIIAYSAGKQVLEMNALVKLGAQPSPAECGITYFVNGGYNSSDVYITDAGGVNFTTCDTIENIIQGTFSVENAQNSDSVSIVLTNGTIYFNQIEKQ